VLRGTPAWYSRAPGVTLFAVVIGSVTRPMSVKKSSQACGPASSVAIEARTAMTIPPDTTAAQRRVRRAQASTRPGWILIAAPRAPATPRAGPLWVHRQPLAQRRDRD